MNGITRGKVIEVCRQNEIPVREKNFSLFDVYGATEAFVTGTFGGLTPVNVIDGRVIRAESLSLMTERLHVLYHELIEADVASQQ